MSDGILCVKNNQFVVDSDLLTAIQTIQGQMSQLLMITSTQLNQLFALVTQVAQLTTQLINTHSTDTAQISSLQSQISTLQTQIADLSDPSIQTNLSAAISDLTNAAAAAAPPPTATPPPPPPTTDGTAVQS